jgi:hypothetical protein
LKRRPTKLIYFNGEPDLEQRVLDRKKDIEEFLDEVNDVYETIRQEIIDKINQETYTGEEVK